MEPLFYFIQNAAEIVIKQSSKYVVTMGGIG